MSRVDLSPIAEEDLLQIFAYIARDSLPSAERIWARFTRVFEMLGRQPLIGEACDHLLPALRSFSVGSYVVYYRPLHNGVHIVRVLHGARDISRLF